MVERLFRGPIRKLRVERAHLPLELRDALAPRGGGGRRHEVIRLPLPERRHRADRSAVIRGQGESAADVDATGTLDAPRRQPTAQERSSTPRAFPKRAPMQT